MSSTNSVDIPQLYYLYRSPNISYSYYNMVVVINTRCYGVSYNGSRILHGAGNVMVVLENWESHDVSLTVTSIRPDEIPEFMKFTSVHALHDYIKSVICLEAL